jgi:hypothetical protein
MSGSAILLFCCLLLRVLLCGLPLHDSEDSELVKNFKKAGGLQGLKMAHLRTEIQYCSTEMTVDGPDTRWRCSQPLQVRNPNFEFKNQISLSTLAV